MLVTTPYICAVIVMRYTFPTRILSSAYVESTNAKLLACMHVFRYTVYDTLRCIHYYHTCCVINKRYRARIKRYAVTPSMTLCCPVMYHNILIQPTLGKMSTYTYVGMTVVITLLTIFSFTIFFGMKYTLRIR